ncbi:MAG: DUF3037 domain-containing protein [Myxococcales bacterium]|nr:DUF3037 domain-containing protein [Myxococcales bacterium]MCB9521537.1 DUF3037 domain-containing protein [Myxococcales bacterium]MCB9531745.1 DUF3037 domain-containing protein [Myxococcales bacterium]MCB9534088.1 DUF3037 domain-containing protein [Myxococcales bacterium]
MSYTPASYSLIQFVPSPRREESMNIGVVVVFRDTGELHWRVDQRAVGRAAKQFLPPDVRRKVALQAKAVEAHLRRIAQRHAGDAVDAAVMSLRDRLANEVRLTSLHPTQVESEPAAAVSKLLAELVHRALPAPSRRDPVHRHLGKLLKDADLADYVEQNVDRSVTLFGAERQLKFPFAFQNGCMNYISTHRIDAVEDEQFLLRAALSRQTADALAEKQARLVVFVESDDAGTAPELSRALSGTTATVVSADDPSALLAEIRHARQLHASAH